MSALKISSTGSELTNPSSVSGVKSRDKKAEFTRFVGENAAAPAGERLSKAELVVDPEYDEILEGQGKEMCEEVCHIILVSLSTVIIAQNSRRHAADLFSLGSQKRALKHPSVVRLALWTYLRGMAFEGDRCWGLSLVTKWIAR